MAKESSEICCIAPTGDICGEGAVWHPEQGALYWTDINRYLVHRLDPASTAVTTWLFAEPVTAISLTTDVDQLLVVLASQVALWSPRSHPQLKTTFRLSGAPEMRFNDARVDFRGSLWAGTMRNNVGPQGENLDVAFTNAVLYRIDPGGNASEWKKDIGISNTVAWSPDRKTFYFGDTVANAIYSFAYDEGNGAISGEKVHFAGYHRGLPDGSAIDAQGYLWNARYGGGCIVRIAPNGSLDRVVSLPVQNPTTCTFGGPEFKTLYVTSARSAERLSGSLFAMQPEIAGLPDGRFRLE